MKFVGIWLGMVGLLVLSYGVLIDYPYRKGWLPQEVAALIVLAMTAGYVYLGVRLTRQELRRRRVP